MELNEMIKVMQHYENGGEVECKSEFDSGWEECHSPIWDWSLYDYRIKEQKQKVVIERWLIKDNDGRFFIKEGDKRYMSYNFRHKVKLLETYEVEI